MVFLLEIRNQDQKKYDEIFIHFKVVNEATEDGEMKIRNLFCGGVGSTHIANDVPPPPAKTVSHQRTLLRIQKPSSETPPDPEAPGESEGPMSSSSSGEESEGYFTDSGNQSGSDASTPESPVKVPVGGSEAPEVAPQEEEPAEQAPPPEAPSEEGRLPQVPEEEPEAPVEDTNSAKTYNIEDGGEAPIPTAEQDPLAVEVTSEDGDGGEAAVTTATSESGIETDGSDRADSAIGLEQAEDTEVGVAPPLEATADTDTSSPPQVSTPPPPTKCPVAPLTAKNPTQMELTAYLTKVQEYINQLGYHRQGEPATKVLTSMSVKHQVDTAKLLIKSSDPIKCLHALVLGIYFTNCTNYVERFPINFRSVVAGKEYKHVVLGLYMYGNFGAIGISRDPGLQDKPPVYPKLYDLILEFEKCYGQSGHVLKEVRIGGIITHDPHSLEPIHWKLASPVDMQEKNGQETAFEKITRLLRSKMCPTCLRSSRRASATPPTASSPETPAAAPTTKIRTSKNALRTKSKTIANMNTSKDSNSSNNISSGVKNPKA